MLTFPHENAHTSSGGRTRSSPEHQLKNEKAFYIAQETRRYDERLKAAAARAVLGGRDESRQPCEGLKIDGFGAQAAGTGVRGDRPQHPMRPGTRCCPEKLIFFA